MNKNKCAKCPVCGIDENWSHVIRCPRLKEKNMKLIETLSNELNKLENRENVRWKKMINDLEYYLTNKEDMSTMQQTIGCDMVFRGFIVKDWFGTNRGETKYQIFNKVTVKLCVQHYWTCWKERNDIMNTKEIKRKFVLEWHENEVEKNVYHQSENVRKYIREYAGSVKNQATDHIQRWLIGLNNVI